MTQYVCKGWTGTGNVPASGITTNTGSFNMTGDSTLVWLWTTNYLMDTATNGNGTVNVPDGWWPKGSNVQITATADEHYHFAFWSGQTNGCTFTSNVITAPMTAPRVITANFVVDQHSLIVTTPYGKASPSAGTNWFNWNGLVAAALTNSPVVNGTTQYVCTGWTGMGSVPLSGAGTNTGLFTLTNNSSVAWQWSTNYRLDTVVNGKGTVNQADQWCYIGSNVVITATPSVSNRFIGWTGQTNGCTISSNQIAAPMTMPRQITANFIQQYSLTVNNGTGSDNTYTNLQRVEIAADAPAVGKYFDRWTGSIQYVANVTSATTTVTMPPQNIALTATYKAIYCKLTVIGGTGGGSFTNNQRVTIRASVPAGMKFSRWNDGDTNVSRIITMPPEPVTYTANFTDITKPTVAIKTPTALQKVFGITGNFTVTGTALDNLALSNVMVSVNGASAVPANATTNGLKSWALPVTLLSSINGVTNMIAAHSVDTTGNSSVTVTVKCVYTETGALNITTNGPGKVTVTPTGPLLLNKTYTLTAAAGAGAVFSNWTGDVTSTGKVIKVTLDSTNKTVSVTASFTDTAKPTVVITYPANNAKVLTNGLVVIRGTAADNGALSEVKYQLRTGDWTNAVSTNGLFKPWTAPYVPAAGLNTSKVYSVDAQGNS
jgi:hypothetical protein